jgi:hypothetical protein
VLLEKDRLRKPFFGFPKVAQPNADESIALLRVEINPLSQLQGNASQFFARSGWRELRVATGENLELAGPLTPPWVFRRT